MNAEEFEFPTHEEQKRIYDHSPLSSVFSLLSNRGSSKRVHHSWEILPRHKRSRMIGSTKCSGE